MSSKYVSTYVVSDTSRLNPNLPALTTIFTPAPECTNRWMSGDGSPGGFVISAKPPAQFTPGMQDPIWSSCQPLSFQPIYSPGVCQSGHTVDAFYATNYIVNGISNTVWEGYCCPSGMQYEDMIRQLCTGTLTTPLRVYNQLSSVPADAAVSPIGPYVAEYVSEVHYSLWSDSRSWDMVSRLTVANIKTITTPTKAVAQAQRVQWESSDLSRFPPAYATSLASVMEVSFTPNASPGSTTTLSRETNPPNRVLSTGAKAGIGIGAVLGVALIAGIILGIFLIRKRRRAGQQPTATEAASTPEMEDQDETLASRKWFLSGKWRSEAETHNKPSELDSRGVHVVPGPPVELDAEERLDATRSGARGVHVT